jgi:hypothetical protein
MKTTAETSDDHEQYLCHCLLENAYPMPPVADSLFARIRYLEGETAKRERE